eukprot:PITA_32277
MDVSYDHELNLSTDFEPTSYKEVTSHGEWKEAMQKEYDALIKNDTWKLVDPTLRTKQLSWNNESYIVSIKKKLRKGFEMTDLGYVHYYLGIEVTQHPNFIFLSQKKFIRDMLNMFDKDKCNPLIIPMEHNLKLISTEGKEFEDATKYRQLIKNLNYLTTIDQTFHLLLESSPSLCKSLVGSFSLIGYSDLDFDGDKEIRISTSGYVMSLGSGVVTWRSRKQSVPVDSTTEAKYVAAVEATNEIVWLGKILEYLQEKQVHSTPHMININFAIKLAKNPKFHD